MDPRSLIDRWREDASVFRRRGATEAACTLEDCARELEQSLIEWDAQPLTLDQAATESGYSADHIRRLLSTGSLSNVGKKGAPRVRRADLPRKGGRRRRTTDGEPDLAGAVLAARGLETS